MNGKETMLVKNLLGQKNFNAVNEFSQIVQPEKGNIIITEYAGMDVRCYKDNGETKILYPKNATVVQEGHVAQAIANGSIFDDAEDVDNNATMIERTSLPYDAMINSGKEPPKCLKPMIAIIIGRMDDNGSCAVSDADRTNGVNFIKDLVDTKKEDNDNNINDVVNNYLDHDSEKPYTRDMGKSITELDKELDDVVATEPEDVISDEDTVDSYDDIDIEAIEKGSDKDGDNNSDDNESDNNDDDNEGDEETVEECGDGCGSCNQPKTVTEDGEESIDNTVDAAVASSGVTDDNIADDTNDTTGGTETIQEEDNAVKNANVTTPPTEGTDAHGNINTAPAPMSAETKAIVNQRKLHQEGFLTKKPKKLKPIPRDIIAYITCEMNDIHSANDQAMLAGYTCSKIELVDFYITALDTQDARYIVPHNRQYLGYMKNELERLLTQILRIRPINRADQIWRVNYPTM